MPSLIRDSTDPQLTACLASTIAVTDASFIVNVLAPLVLVPKAFKMKVFTENTLIIFAHWVTLFKEAKHQQLTKDNCTTKFTKFKL